MNVSIPPCPTHGYEFDLCTTVCGHPAMRTMRTLRVSDIKACSFLIMDPDHYREDGSCRCDDAEHRVVMIRDWDYSESDFSDIPLRSVTA